MEKLITTLCFGIVCVLFVYGVITEKNKSRARESVDVCELRGHTSLEPSSPPSLAKRYCLIENYLGKAILGVRSVLHDDAAIDDGTRSSFAMSLSVMEETRLRMVKRRAELNANRGGDIVNDGKELAHAN